MIYDWYKIINLAEFEALDLVSRNLELILGNIGLANVLVTKGNMVSILYNGIFLSIGLNDESPFEFEGHAVYLDANDDVWLGILNED